MELLDLQSIPAYFRKELATEEQIAVKASFEAIESLRDHWTDLDDAPIRFVVDPAPYRFGEDLSLVEPTIGDDSGYWVNPEWLDAPIEALVAFSRSNASMAIYKRVPFVP